MWLRFCEAQIPNLICASQKRIYTIMTPTILSFMSNIVDYAGLFPPAQLDMAEAEINFDEYQHGIYSWMLGKFVAPAMRLSEIRHPTANLSILGKGGKDSAEFFAALRNDLENVAAYVTRLPNRKLPYAFEVVLPETVASLGEGEVVKFISEVRGMMLETHLPSAATFYEVSFKGNWEKRLETVSRVIAKRNRQQGSGHSDYMGIKLRTGGIVADAFPSAEQVAAAIVACRDAGVPFKCTAGLHHPFRRFDESVQTKMHGFVNVFGGAALAHALTLDEKTLTEILLDEDGHHFLFSDDKFGWKNLLISRNDLEKARREFAISFGSCSFTEPIEDLQKWKLL